METNHSLSPLRPGDRLLDIGELKRLYPKSTSGIYAEVRTGKFPAPVRIGPNRVAWVERLVLEHLNRIIGAAAGDQASPCPRA